jgi:ABC-2 type transport system permease protein
MIFLSALPHPKERRKIMRKIFIIAMREYKAAVRTKSFIVSLVLMPVLMGGSTVVSIVSQSKKDTSDKKFIFIDHSGLFSGVIQQGIKQHNDSEIFDAKTHEKIRPAYYVEFIEPNTANPAGQKLELSKRIAAKEIYGFFEIGSSILHPGKNPENAYIRFYSENAFLDETRGWFANVINNHLRQLRLADLNLPPESTMELFNWTNIEGLGLLKVDESTGIIKDAEESNVVQSILIPYVLVMLMFMMAMMGVSPLLTAVMEEKMGKIAEVLLATVTPFQFMAGKILGSTSVSLTTAAIYITGGVITMQQLGAGDKIPYDLLPWFFLYLVFFLIMAGSIMSAFGSACNDNKDAQNIMFPAMLPMIVPLFVVWPVVQNPMGSLAIWMSLFPPFTPMLMTVRMASPVSIPVWQPIAGLIGVVLFTALSVWVASRIFRTGILMQGQKPTLANLVKYALKG